MIVLEHSIKHGWPMSNPHLERWVSYPDLLSEFWWNWEIRLSDTWLNLVSHELALAIKYLFLFFNKCVQFINSPSCCVLDARNTRSKCVSLTWNFQISSKNSLQHFLIFSHSMSICFFEFCWIKPSNFIETKIYVQNDFKAASTTFLSSTLWNHFLTMELSNKAMEK